MPTWLRSTQLCAGQCTPTTCLGAAYAAGLAVGYWPDIESLRANWKKSVEWIPQMSSAERGKGFRKWKKAVKRTMDWTDADEEG